MATIRPTWPGILSSSRQKEQDIQLIIKMIRNIALVAHDARKAELVNWVKFNAGSLQSCRLYCTGTTGRLIEEALREELGDRCPEITKLLSGPLGGDAQISAMIAEYKVDMLVFFCDNLIMQGHQNDVMGLVRLASLYNVPFATNRSTADFIISSPLFHDPSYERVIPACIESYKNRKL